MTPFMLRIEELLETGGDTSVPELRESRPRTIGEGTHEQVELRSLAEQLVSEANAVLAGTGPAAESVELVDETGTDVLAFVLRYRGSWAQVVTSFADRQSWGRLVTPDATGPLRELAGPEALPDLIVALIAAAGPAWAGAK